MSQRFAVGFLGAGARHQVRRARISASLFLRAQARVAAIVMRGGTVPRSANRNRGFSYRRPRPVPRLPAARRARKTVHCSIISHERRWYERGSRGLAEASGVSSSRSSQLT